MLNVKTLHTEKVFPPDIKLVWPWLTSKDIIFFKAEVVHFHNFFFIIAAEKADWPVRLT